MNAPTDLQTMKTAGNALQAMPDQAVDMFTERGFVLANRVAKAYASSDAVPAQFRAYNLKKAGREENWVENPSAIGNCLVAIEVARAVRMSITAVMQNADMIEGKLRWSGKFVIAAINASGRFTPLRFQMINKGPITASYKEKTGWDREANRPIMVDRTVDVDNIECIAWALPKGTPEPQITPEMVRKFEGRMLDLYKALGMPVIESAPVTMKMAVEEGWYGKSGSKWQTELRTQMFMYRAGSFFGNIHAPDIVMGMGRTSEEERDIVDVFPDGSYSVGKETVDINDLRTRAAPADVVREPTDHTGEVTRNDDAGQSTPGDSGATQGSTPGGEPNFEDVRRELMEAKTIEDLDFARSMIKKLENEEDKAELNQIATQRMRDIAPPQDTPSQTTTSTRRTRTPVSAD